MAKKTTTDSDSYIDKASSRVKAILKNVKKRDSLLIRVLYETACSTTELINIRVQDVKTDSILIGKRTAKITKELSIALRQVESDFVFSTRQSPQLDVRRVQQIVKKTLGITPTELRQIGILEATSEKKKQFGLKEKEHLTPDQVRRVQSGIKNRTHQLMFNLLLKTGCHISELVQLKVEDVKEDHILFGKRKVEIDKELAEEIKQAKGYVFSSRQNSNISDKRVFQILKKYGMNAGIKLNPRILRNTRIASMFAAGFSRSEIEAELGIKRLEFSKYGLLK